MKPSDETHAELKRLYVREEYRGKKLGLWLTERIMEDARKESYTWLRLDTLPGLKSAIHLYRELGFYDVDPYYDCLVPGTIFMEIKL